MVPARAENEIDPGVKERAHCLFLKKDVSRDNGRMPEAICQQTVSPCFWLRFAFSPTLLRSLTPLNVIAESCRLAAGQDIFVSAGRKQSVSVSEFLWCLTRTLTHGDTVSVYTCWRSFM